MNNVARGEQKKHMGGRASTEVKQQFRQGTVESLRQSTMDRLATVPKLLTSAPHGVDDGHDALAQLHAHATTFAQRGGAALLKGELVHIIMALRLGRGETITFAMYAALMMRGADELHAVLRALMYSPEVLQPLLSAVNSSLPPPTPTPAPVTASAASAACLPSGTGAGACAGSGHALLEELPK